MVIILISHNYIWFKGSFFFFWPHDDKWSTHASLPLLKWLGILLYTFKCYWRRWQFWRVSRSEEFLFRAITSSHRAVDTFKVLNTGSVKFTTIFKIKYNNSLMLETFSEMFFFFRCVPVSTYCYWRFCKLKGYIKTTATLIVRLGICLLMKIAIYLILNCLLHTLLQNRPLTNFRIRTVSTNV